MSRGNEIEEKMMAKRDTKEKDEDILLHSDILDAKGLLHIIHKD
jgi:hypothetical protein